MSVVRARFGGSCTRAGLVAALLLGAAVPCWSEVGVGSTSASARVTLRVTVPPVFRILSVKPVGTGYEYRVWTNMRTVLLNGRPFHFDRVGETTLTVPSAPGALYVHPDL